MTDFNERRRRVEQIAATILYRYFGEISINAVPYNLPYDFMVTFNDGTNLRFGVEIKLAEETNKDVDNLIERVLSIDYSEQNNRIPVVVLFVNDETENAKIAFLLGWRFGKPQIYRDFELRVLNEKTAGICKQIIKSMSEEIRLLSVDDLNVIKHISFSRKGDRNGDQSAEIVYLRKLSPSYKMMKKEVINERERFERLVKGIPEEEYPKDILDEMILDVIKGHFIKVRVKSNLLLFSTELDKLQSYSHFHCHRTSLIVSPETSFIYDTRLNNMLNGLQFFTVDLEIYVQSVINQNAFDDISFFKEVSSDGWVRKVTELNRLKDSFHLISEFFR